MSLRSRALDGDELPLAADGRDEIVAVMGDQRDAECVDTPAERGTALIAFLGAGLPSPPSKALVVEALAGAPGDTLGIKQPKLFVNGQEAREYGG